MKRLNRSGFSLIEIMVVIAIVGIVSLIAIPNMISWRGERQLEGAARSFLADMQLARLRAVREAEDVSVVVNVAGDSYQMIVDSDSDYTLDAGEIQLRSRTMPTGIIIVSTTFAGDRTQFDSRGRPNIIGRATFRNTANSTREVFVNRVGRLRIQ